MKKKQKKKTDSPKVKKEKTLNEVIEEIRRNKPSEKKIKKTKNKKSTQKKKKKGNKPEHQIEKLKKTNKRKVAQFKALNKAYKKLQKRALKKERRYRKLKAKIKALKNATQAPESLVDNLKIIEGIGPKIEQLLNDAAIYTYKELSIATDEELREILTTAGSIYRLHNPSTWPLQAGLAAQNDWDSLNQMKDELKSGKQ